MAGEWVLSVKGRGRRAIIGFRRSEFSGCWFDGLRAREQPGTDVLRWPVVGRFLRWKHARTALQTALLIAAAILVLHGLAGPGCRPGQSRHGPHLGPLSRAADRRAARGRQPLLRRMSVRPGARRGAAAALADRCTGRSACAANGSPSCSSSPFSSATSSSTCGRCRARRRISSSPTLPRRSSSTPSSRARRSASTSARSVSSISSPRRSRRWSCRSASARRARPARTSDCIAGRRSPQAPQVVVQRGCELGLFLPAKVGNIDCTFCLDCVHACPHDNIALAGAHAGPRARGCAAPIGHRPPDGAPGPGRSSPCCSSLAPCMNAFAMIGPVHQLEAVARGDAGDDDRKR